MSQAQSYLSYFTPSQMSAEMLESILVKRQNLAARLVEKTKQSVLTPAKHQTLLLGPRGMGKSYLVALVYHRVKALPELADKIAIAYFAEEEWSIASLTDLLLVILKALEREYGGIQSRIEALYRLPVREIEAEAGTLIREFVGERTLFLLVENLNEIFRGLGDQGEWAFRSFISERPFVTILATTPSLFAGITEHDSAFYGFFQNIYLEELTAKEATELLEKVAKRRDDKPLAAFLKTPTARERVQAVHDLAGGHPRIYLLFAHLLTQETLDELVTPFMKLLDELTPYYQSRMQLLSPQQRKIVEFLCSARGAISVKEIAAQNLMTSQTASGQLDKLEEMAYVRKTPVGRASLYELREPLLRMVIEVKRGRGEPIRLIVDFLRRWYNRKERQERLSLDPKEPRIWFYRGTVLQRLNDYSAALSSYANAIKFDPMNADMWGSQGIAQWKSGDATSALASFDMALVIDPESPNLWIVRGMILCDLNNYSLALASFDQGIKVTPLDARAWFYRAETELALGNWEECVRSIQRYFELSPKPEGVLWRTKNLCNLLLRQQDLQEKIKQLTHVYAENADLGSLGQGVAESIPDLLMNSVPQSTAQEWLASWKMVCDTRTEFNIVVRILAAAVEWKKTRSVQALMSLPIEERRILESLLPNAEGNGEP